MDSKETAIKYYIKSNNLEYNVFDQNKNVFVESDKEVFRMISFGKSMVFIGRKDLINWAKKNFIDTVAEDIIDGKNLQNYR